jgi:hypothetical protein
VQVPGRLYQRDHSKTAKARMTMRRRIWHRLSRWSSCGPLIVMSVLTGCGEPMFENAGSQHSLVVDREACAMEMEQSPEALAYRIYRHEPLHRTKRLEAGEVSARARTDP